jgi:DNA (cytosine-5)-methyltransferase 1
MTAYYNEFNPECAAMLRQLITDGHIAPGDVDERSITEVKPDDLKGYTQCHFFAGIGGWSIALRLAGWPDDKPVWTGSAPCQPFSSAGKQKGKADERHLAPCWLRLITECRPELIYGEQVASAIAHGWLDDVFDGLEAQGYACGAAVLPACSVGAPHKRDRLWFVAHTVSKGLEGYRDVDRQPIQKGWVGEERHPWESGILLKSYGNKKRLVEPSIPLLVDGFQHRRPLLHALGNAIVPQVAAQFIEASTHRSNER